VKIDGYPALFEEEPGDLAVHVVSSRAPAERVGIVALEPVADRLTIPMAALYNHGVTSTTRAGTVRLSTQATTEEGTFSMLRSELLSYSTAG